MMSISDTVSSVAATNPIVGTAVASANTNSALLAGMQTGDTATTALLGAVTGQALEANQLLSSLTPALTPNLGQNINTLA